MRWGSVLGCGLVLGACVGEGSDADVEDSVADSVADSEAGGCDDKPWLTWQGYARGHLTTWCTPCHSRQVPVEERSGAPVGVDFDTLEDVRRFAERIAVTGTGAEARMPPAGGVSDEAKDLLAEWLACGAPGEEVSVDPCLVRTTREGDVVLGSQAELDALCATANVVTGDLTVQAELELSCLCEVGGDVIVGPGVASLTASRLSEVGGDLDVMGHGSLRSVVWPSLARVGGSVRLGGASLGEVSLGGLSEVGGELVVSGTSSLLALDFERLAVVGGDLRVSGHAGLRALRLVRVGSVGGALVVEVNPALSELADLASLRTVGGELRLAGLPGVEELVGLDELLTVGGDLVIAELAGLVNQRGFLKLTEVGGTLRIADNERLFGVFGFGALATVGGGVWIERNPELSRIHDFGALQSVGASGDWERGEHQLRLAHNPALETVTAFAAVSRLGGLVIEDNDRLVELGRDLTLLTTIDRELVIAGNAALASLAQFPGSIAVGTDVWILNNPALATSRAEALVARIGAENIGGEVRVEGNR